MKLVIKTEEDNKFVVLLYNNRVLVERIEVEDIIIDFRKDKRREKAPLQLKLFK